MDLEFMILDTFDNVRPSLKLKKYEKYEDVSVACKKIEQWENENFQVGYKEEESCQQKPKAINKPREEQLESAHDASSLAQDKGGNSSSASAPVDDPNQKSQDHEEQPERPKEPQPGSEKGEEEEDEVVLNIKRRVIGGYDILNRTQLEQYDELVDRLANEVDEGSDIGDDLPPPVVDQPSKKQ